MCIPKIRTTVLKFKNYVYLNENVQNIYCIIGEIKIKFWGGLKISFSILGFLKFVQKPFFLDYNIF